MWPEDGLDQCLFELREDSERFLLLFLCRLWLEEEEEEEEETDSSAEETLEEEDDFLLFFFSLFSSFKSLRNFSALVSIFFVFCFSSFSACFSLNSKDFF